MSVALMVAILAGWVAHYVPAGDTRAHATGTAGEDPTATTDAAADAGPSGAAAPGDAATTSFVTSCGKLLDVVPTRAVAHDTAVQVTLELHPVCPTGEWIESRAFHVVLSDATGAELASGSFDLTDQPVLSPGFGDPASEVVARFGRGTAWASPDALAAAIADGTVVVACEAGDGMTGTPVPAGDVTGAVRRTVEASAPAPAAGRSREETALAALRRQARVDDPSVSLLEGAWVPQLSSKRSGTYDHHDAHAYSLADIYQQFLSLRLRFPQRPPAQQQRLGLLHAARLLGRHRGRPLHPAEPAQRLVQRSPHPSFPVLRQATRPLRQPGRRHPAPRLTRHPF
ncbi:hypothetical protein [Nocardioides ginsengisegetis]